MKYSLLICILLVMGLLVAACGSVPVNVPTEVQPLATAIVETASGVIATVESAATATAEAGVPVTGAATVKVAQSDSYGPILVDGDGLALYIFMNDTQNGSSSACTDEECITEWPPLTTTAAPVAGEGATQDLLGTITRADGTMQVTYNGWPLHHFDEDTEPGSTNGQGMEGLWFLVSPAGDAIK